MPRAQKVSNEKIAVAYLQSQRETDDIFYVESVECFYGWIAEKYVRPFKPDHLKRKIWWFLHYNHGDQDITDSQVNDIYKQMRFACDKRMEKVQDRYIAFDDCLLNVDTFETEPFSKEKYSSFFIPYAYASLASHAMPVFDKFLQTTLVREDEKSCCDIELVDVVQELLGYLLLPSLDAAAAFFFVGEGANGKSVLAAVASALVRDEYVSAMSIEMLTVRPFSVAELVGKKLNVCNEEESKYMKSDRFKTLVSGDPVSAERKFGGVFRFTPTAKYIFCSNNMPTFEGLNYGLTRRVKIIPFNQTFANGTKDRKMTEKLMAELPGIIWWALKGAKRLVEQDFVFSRSQAMDEKLLEFESEVSAALLFFRTCYEIEKTVESVVTDEDDSYKDFAETDKNFVTNDVLYAEYKTWCEQNGRKPMNSMNFFKEIAKQYGATIIVKKEGNAQRGRRIKKIV